MFRFPLLVAATLALASHAAALPAPKLEGLQIDEARKIAQSHGIVLSTAAVENSLERRGKVLLQSPGEGVELGKTNRLFIEYSDGVSVPNLLGKSKVDALSQIDSLKISVEATESKHIGIPRGHVAKQTPPPGYKLDASTEVVFLSVAGGHYVNVPAVRDLPLHEAITSIEGRKLKAQEDPVDAVYASRSTKTSLSECNRHQTIYDAVATGTDPPESSEVYPDTKVTVLYKILERRGSFVECRRVPEQRICIDIPC